MEKKYTVAMVGLGSRGLAHLEGLYAKAGTRRFEVLGLCDHRRANMEKAAERFSLGSEKFWDDADKMLGALKPDVLCFATLPRVRLELVELAAKHKVRGLMFEKPMAESAAEARRIYKICQDAGIKAIVCHQHKYLPSFLKLKEAIDSNSMGKITRISARCQSWMAHSATHYTDYIIWANRGIGIASVTGHIHGRDRLSDNHPSPDFFMGEYVMRNGVRADIQCGYFSKPYQEHDEDYQNNVFSGAFFTDCRLMVYGETGYAWAACNGPWAVCSVKDGFKEGAFAPWPEERIGAQARYTEAFARWLDDDAALHPCNVETAYNGYQAVEAVVLSALDKTRVDLPLERDKDDVLKRMKEELQDTPRRKLP
ncbi:MAG: Gfo/Idh/MocA family oxidoreductase [Treponema sp.]|nr:Gfo/Idh/MocA family oxidoreductase [Treponema sp.]